MESPSQVQKSASLLETEYCQSPSGQAVAYVLKESQNLGNTGAVASPKIASPYASKKSVTLTEISQKIEDCAARRDMLMEDIKAKNRDHVDRVKQVRRSLVEKEEAEQELKKKQIEEKLLTAQENKLKDLEKIRDKCYQEERKLQLAQLRREGSNIMSSQGDSQEDIEN
ncbi:uncharacterized protein LOC134843832 [Symsagittifera roscoffensis]|uniref:uncharacterized protein LOC134843832 n=1 Tax=Symsagittifera roscoffensis TaxID=84072 RepID=UPI00307BDBB9